MRQTAIQIEIQIEFSRRFLRYVIIQPICSFGDFRTPRNSSAWKSILIAWTVFGLSAVLILIAGTKLTQYGDQIAEHSGLGRLWIGVAPLGAATSLPEVFTAVSAVLIDAPILLAVGDLFGAGLGNMLTLALIDVAYRRKQV